MKGFASEKIRNVSLLSHGGAGKTSFTEAVLYNAGLTDRLGNVVDGNTVTDFDPEEIKRTISISLAVAPFEWKDHKVNFIDTPGYFDFVGEVKQAVRVSETALIFVAAKGGVQVGTEKSLDYAKENNMAKVIVINKMDEENADFYSVYDRLKEIIGPGAVALQLPIIENEKFLGYVDVLESKAKKDVNGKLVDVDIPTDLKDRMDEIAEKLNESIAETDEALMDKYFNGETFSPEEIRQGLKKGISDGVITPIFCASSIKNIGTEPILNTIVSYCPSPVDKEVINATKIDSDDVIEIKTGTGEPVSALVFKTVADPFVGKISLIRVFSGILKADSVVLNAETQKNEKMTNLFIMRGKKNIPVRELVAGDIGGLSKLSNTNTNDTLTDVSRPIKLEKIVFPEPAISLAVESKAKGDEEKVNAGLHRLMDEDVTFKVTMNTETHQTLISGVGEQHLDIIVSKLKAKFGVSVDLIEPRVPYRETIKKKVKVEGKHKKQSGGHGQYGHVWMEFEPGQEDDLVFEEKIFGGSVPKQYFPAVEKGLRDSIKEGVLAGYPVVNLKATLVDGSYHSVDSSEMAFKMAASLAYKKGLEQAGPVLLEPICHVEVYIPDNYMGDIIGDLNKRRGRILGMNPKDNGIQQVVAEVPEAEMFKYATDLRSMTQGRGYFKMNFERYEEAPQLISQKVIEEAKKANEE